MMTRYICVSVCGREWINTFCSMECLWTDDKIGQFISDFIHVDEYYWNISLNNNYCTYFGAFSPFNSIQISSDQFSSLKTIANANVRKMHYMHRAKSQTAFEYTSGGKLNRGFYWIHMIISFVHFMFQIRNERRTLNDFNQCVKVCMCVCVCII